MPDPRSLSADVMAATLAAEGHVHRAHRRFRELVTLKRNYRRLFFDNAGHLKPEARDVLADLLRASGMATATRDLDHAWLAQREGQRLIVLHIFQRLQIDDSRLDQLELDLTQAMEDDDQ